MNLAWCDNILGVIPGVMKNSEEQEGYFQFQHYQGEDIREKT